MVSVKAYSKVLVWPLPGNSSVTLRKALYQAHILIICELACESCSHPYLHSPLIDSTSLLYRLHIEACQANQRLHPVPRLLSQPRMQTPHRESKDKVRGRKTRKKRKERKENMKRRRKKIMMRKTSPVPQIVGVAWSGDAGSARHDTEREMITLTT